MRVTHIVLDCHFHHEQQWRAAMTTTHSLHQLKYIIIHPKFWANHYIESESSVSVTFLGKWDDAVIMSVTNQGTVLMKRSTEQRNVLHLCCSALQHTNLNFSLTTNRRLHLYEVDQKVGNLAVINIPLKLMSLTTCRSRPNCFLCSSSVRVVAKFSASIQQLLSQNQSDAAEVAELLSIFWWPHTLLCVAFQSLPLQAVSSTLLHHIVPVVGLIPIMEMRHVW